MNQSHLSIDGGETTFPEGPPKWPIADDDILHNVQTALADGSWGKYESDWTEQVAKRLAELTQCENIMLCSSGTVAVEIALRAVDVQPESEVILAAYDFPGNFRAIEAIGARPVIVDVIEDGYVIDPDEVAAAISEKTKAIIVSHLHGQIADMPTLKTICEENNLRLIEDVCQTPGGCLNESPLGRFGDVGVFSFGGSKLLSAGRGGAVVTKNADFYQRAKIYCNRGNEAFPFSQLQAAALLPQFEKLESRNVTRRQRVEQLLEATNQITILKPLKQQTGDVFPVFYKLPWLIENSNTGWTRSEFVQAVQAEGLAIDTGFRGFTRRSVKRCRQHGPLINSRIASQQTVILHHPVLLESEAIIDRAAYALNKVALSRS